MALDLSKLNIPSLNRREITDLKASRKFPVDLEGVFTEAVLDYRYNPEEIVNGKTFSRNFQATVKILEAENPAHVGRTYTLRFYLDNKFQQYADKERRQFIAACMGAEWIDEKFDCNAAQQDLLDMSDVGSDGYSELNPAGDPPCRIVHIRETGSKERAVIDPETRKPVLEKYNFAKNLFEPV